MLNAFELPGEAYGHMWSIRRFSGDLVQYHATTTRQSQQLPQKVLEALKCCAFPFDCVPSITGAESCSTIELKPRLISMHQKLLKLGNHRFLLSRLYASHRVTMFADTREAMNAIAQLPEQRAQHHQLCLQRTLLAAKTSKTFAANGVIFIGAFLPTTSMHAWIIESGRQPDTYDRTWINYRPLLALCHP
jgi:hypothetical protein